MKNNTKIRLHLTKQLFESLTKQVIAESKGKHYGAGMEEVKSPKAPKMEAMKPKKGNHELDKLKEMKKQLDKQINEMETMTAEAPNHYKKDVSEFGPKVNEAVGMEQALTQVANAISSGDPFSILVGTVLALVGGAITADVAGPKIKKYWQGFKQEDAARAATIEKIADEGGVDLQSVAGSAPDSQN
jgi:uncharacterized protein YaaR (DUF327 family)